MKIIDCHNDFITDFNDLEILDYIAKCKKEEVAFLACSYFTTKKQYCIVPKEIKHINSLLNPFKDTFKIHIEDLWFVNDGNLKDIIELSPFSCSLTWNHDNNLAGGCYGEKGLSKWGEEVVKNLFVNKIKIDLAHLNRNSFYQVANLIGNKLYVSHTGFCDVVDDKRNLTPNQIELVRDSGGFIGLFFYNKLLKPNSILSATDIALIFAKHCEMYGDKHIGFGSDFNGIPQNPNNVNSYIDFKNIKNEMLKIGFNISEIKNFFYKNFERFLND